MDEKRLKPTKCASKVKFFCSVTLSLQCYDVMKFMGAEFERFLLPPCHKVILDFALFCVEMLTQLNKNNILVEIFSNISFIYLHISLYV